jgi:hypothetical protein
MEDEDTAFVGVEVVLGAAGASEEVLAAGADVDAAAAAAMVPLRSHGFGGEPIVQNRTLRVENESGCVDGVVRLARQRPLNTWGN